jgi:hypothetical protein
MTQTSSEEATQTWMETIPQEKKIGVVVPLYAYNELGDEQLNWETLSTFLTNIKSNKLKVFTVFVCESPRLSKNVKNVLIGRQQGGGMEILDVDKYFSYGDYLKEGIGYLLEKTDCEYIVVANPWVMLKPNSIDQMAERLNPGDFDIVSGVDLRQLKWGSMDGIPPEQFDTFNFNPPSEMPDKDFDFNFWGMKRGVAQVLKIDPDYKTPYFQQSDIWGSAFSSGFHVVSSQFLPFYSFDIKWSDIETQGDFEEDQQKFIGKWGFNPDAKYT